MAGARDGTAETWRREHESEVATVTHLTEVLRRFHQVRRRKHASEAELGSAMDCARCAVLVAAADLGRDELQDALTNLARVAVVEYARWVATNEWDAARLADAVQEYVSTVEILENRTDLAVCPPDA